LAKVGQDLGDDAVEMDFFLDQVLFSQFQKSVNEWGMLIYGQHLTNVWPKSQKNIKQKVWTNPSASKPGPKKVKY